MGQYPYSYTAYGLGIASALPLPELVAGSAGTDVFISSAIINPKPLPPLTTEPTMLVCANEVCLSYASVGTFLVTQGCEIRYEQFPGGKDDDARLLITGPLLGILLHQRGLVTLHGSCVSFGQYAVTFLAPSTGGKSTMAAMLRQRGHDLLADDITAVALAGDEALVYPAYPYLKLWPEAVEFLGYSPGALPRFHPAEEKRLLSVQKQFSLAPLPLKHIIILSDGDDLSLNRLPKQEAIVELLRHSYCAQLGETVSGPEHFLRCAALAKVTPVYRLSRPRKIERLSEVADLVESRLTS